MPIELSETIPNFTLPDLADQPSLEPEHVPLSVGSRATTVASRYQAVERVILAMRERLNKPLSLETMAEIALLSPYHFNRVFRLITGIPPCKFLNVLRMEAAKRLLVTTQLTAGEVCFSVGYNSQGSFTRDFVRLVGLSPLSLRRLVQDTSMPKQEWLRDHDDAGVCRYDASAGSALAAGRISAPDDFNGVIFVGLFTAPTPQGRPVGCTLLSAPGPYRIAHVPNGTYYVFAAAFPQSEDPLAYLLPDQTNVYVGASQNQFR